MCVCVDGRGIDTYKQAIIEVCVYVCVDGRGIDTYKQAIIEVCVCVCVWMVEESIHTNKL